MRTTGIGHILLALSLAVLGALSVAFPDFGHAWQTIPKAYPWHDTLQTIYGAILLVLGLAVLVPPIARPAALGLAIWVLIRLIIVKLKIVIMNPLVEVAYEDFSENLTYVAGAWMVFSLLPREGGLSGIGGNVRAAQILFGLALLPCGLSHFFYLGQTATLIPSWIPFHVPLSYFTGAAHFAAGVAILVGVLPRLAATLEAVMVSLFTILVWIPMVIGAPGALPNWSEICSSAAISGAAWLVAHSYRERPWGFG